MPQLSRQTGRLLTRVAHKPHATQDDHHDVLLTPPASVRMDSRPSNELRDEDIFADPLSSDEDEGRINGLRLEGVDGGGNGKNEVKNGRRSLQGPMSTATTTRGEMTSLQRPAPFASPSSIVSKRSADQASSGDEDDDDDSHIFTSQGSQQKRQKKMYGSSAVGRHGSIQQRRDAKMKTDGRARAGVKKDGKGGFVKPASLPRNKNGRQAMQRRKIDIPKSTETSGSGRQSRTSELRRPDGVVGADAGVDHERGSLSPPLSSSMGSAPDTSDVEEIETLDLAAPTPYLATSECAICGQQTPTVLKEDFEDRYNNSKPLNFKWQQRYCTFHRQETARETWRERRYPTIDWDGLDARWRRHRDDLRDIITGDVASSFEGEMARRVRSRGKTALQSLNDKTGGRKGSCVSYYGPKGEKLISELLLQDFHAELRHRASSDRLVAASGVSGGVSAFVHTVLVPELIVRLVCEDMRVSQSVAKTIMVDSAELGELLNPEAEEVVVVVAGTLDDGRGKDDDDDNDELDGD